MSKAFYFPAFVLIAYLILIAAPVFILSSDHAGTLCGILGFAFTFIWYTILVSILIGKGFKIDGASLALGALIGQKVFLSLILFLATYALGFFGSKMNVLLFLGTYALYTPIIYYFGNSYLKELAD